MHLNYGLGITYLMIWRVYLLPERGKEVKPSLEGRALPDWGLRCLYCGRIKLGNIELSTIVEEVPKVPLPWQEFLSALNTGYIEAVCPYCELLQAVETGQLYYREGETWKNLKTGEELSVEELLVLL